ncbi:hypothetical protein OG429_13060 [Streptomyces sp. NBC_00190]|uniref:hypothetical protein n=1 Tax=unclassified Streptomyces TaxID=2593676 RepID=UPI002E2BB683|nr:hypothetical protein [Streptomyces sp. NBC_00190]WSZ40197.1 hypothetical protein OG239_16065 [Streptomyces sp. NBC_00868]
MSAPPTLPSVSAVPTNASPSPTPPPSPSLAPSPSPTAVPSPSDTPDQKAPSTAPAPKRTTKAPTSPPAEPADPACEIVSNAGNCYNAGQFCRKADLGRSTHAGNGRLIYCRQDGSQPRWGY